MPCRHSTAREDSAVPADKRNLHQDSAPKGTGNWGQEKALQDLWGTEAEEVRRQKIVLCYCPVTVDGEQADVGN